MMDLHSDDMAVYFRQRGYTVRKTRTLPARPVAFPWRPYTCVEAVKRGLGLHHRAIMTPWQLYRHLGKNKK